MSEDDKKSDNKVGYKNPPEPNRFKPGRSGNPGGRPKKNDVTIEVMIVEKLSKKAPGSENTILEGVVNSVIRNAYKGDFKSSKYLIENFKTGIRQQKISSTTDDADAEAAKRILNLDPHYLADLLDQADADPESGSVKNDDDPE